MTAFPVFITMLSIHSFVPTKMEKHALPATWNPGILLSDRQENYFDFISILALIYNAERRLHFL